VESFVERTETVPLTPSVRRATAISVSRSWPPIPVVMDPGPCTVTAKNSPIGREKREVRRESAIRASVICAAPPRSSRRPTVPPARKAAAVPTTAQSAMTAHRHRTRALPKDLNTAQ
jgi:hypothetical protein